MKTDVYGKMIGTISSQIASRKRIIDLCLDKFSKNSAQKCGHFIHK